jgi:hypothetical protein
VVLCRAPAARSSCSTTRTTSSRCAPFVSEREGLASLRPADPHVFDYDIAGTFDCRPSDATTRADDPLPSPPLPSGAAEVLRADHPLLAEYTSRYRGHPAATSSQWSPDYIRSSIDMQQFGAPAATCGSSGATMHIATASPPTSRASTTSWGCSSGSTRTASSAETYDIDGARIGRDLLDSITELNFLDEELDISRRDFTILDIGAGYGRLAHRATTAFANVDYLCTDVIPLSTFLSRYYLDFRGATRARVVPLDEIAGELAGRHVDLAVNIHSFSEAPISSIRWWLDLIAENDVEHLMIVPNTDTRLLSKELDGPKVDLRPLIEAKGFQLACMRPKYQSEFVQRHGIHGPFPMYYFLFARR